MQNAFFQLAKNGVFVDENTNSIFELHYICFVKLCRL